MEQRQARCQELRFLHDVLGEGDALAEQEALVTIEVTYEFGIWANLSILLDQGSDRRRETGREATSGKKGNLGHDLV